MSERNLIFGIYSQRPLGTNKEDFEFDLVHCYKPVLTYLYANPHIKFSLYLSGIILEWLENEYPEINMLISDMIKNKQIEMLTGGYYDPILSIMPIKDRALQIEKLTTFIRKRFGKRPKCLWLTEQLWNPTLINTLHTCSIESVFINSNTTSYSDTIDNAPFIMQEMGKNSIVFPMDYHLENYIFSDESTINSRLLHSINDNDLGICFIKAQDIVSRAILKNDGDIVDTLVYINNFIKTNDIKPILPSEYIEKYKNQFNKSFLPSGWYRKDQLPAKVNHYQDMFIRYPELMHIYGKMHYVEQLTKNIRKEKSLKKLCIQEILKSQSFGTYTQGISGGIYRNYLRKETYKHLIEAEKASREKGVFTTNLQSYDIDLDLIEEYLYRGKNITSVLDLKGGALTEFDYLITSWNYMDTFVGYSNECSYTNKKNVKNGIRQKSFVDIFLNSNANISQYNKYDVNCCTNSEEYFFNLNYIDKDKRELTCSADIQIECLPKKSKIQVIKSFKFKTNSIVLELQLKNLSSHKVDFFYGSELNISFAYDGDSFYSIRSIDVNHERDFSESMQIMKNVKNLRIRDHYTKSTLSLFSNKRFSIYKDNLNTMITTDAGEEDIYQFTNLLAYWPVTLAYNDEWKSTLVLRIEKNK